MLLTNAGTCDKCLLWRHGLLEFLEFLSCSWDVRNKSLIICTCRYISMYPINQGCVTHLINPPMCTHKPGMLHLFDRPTHVYPTTKDVPPIWETHPCVPYRLGICHPSDPPTHVYTTDQGCVTHLIDPPMCTHRPGVCHTSDWPTYVYRTG